MSDEYIWISRWAEFQHYRPERDRPPAWIKDYTKQLDDGDYLRLTLYQRGILHGLRSAFARNRGRLAAEPRQLTRRLNGRITAANLKALSDAGFIELLSRETLEPRLESLAKERKKEERELDSPLTPAKTAGELTCKQCGEPGEPGKRCKVCGATPRQAGTSVRERRKPSAYQRAEAMTRNVGVQYTPASFHEELDRFDLSDRERDLLEELRSSLNGVTTDPEDELF